MPHVYGQLRDLTSRLEKHYRDMQDFEFTIQDGRLYMLQTRNAKRTGLAAVRIAIDMVRENLITIDEAVLRVEPNQIFDFLVPRLDEKGTVEVLASGLPASPGAAVGQIVFTAAEAVKFHEKGTYKSIILVRARNLTRGHRRHERCLRHPHFPRRHDLPRRPRHPRHGQVLRSRRRRRHHRRKEKRDARQRQNLP